jgi:hypothetical protein
MALSGRSPLWVDPNGVRSSPSFATKFRRLCGGCDGRGCRKADGARRRYTSGIGTFQPCSVPALCLLGDAATTASAVRSHPQLHPPRRNDPWHGDGAFEVRGIRIRLALAWSREVAKPLR